MDTDEIVELGKKLVVELGSERDSDTLSRWMSHYLAELIVKAEHADGVEKQEAQEACFKAILELWDYRHQFPDGRRPFESFEPIFRALEALDPDNQVSRFWPNYPDSVDETDTVEKMIAVAKGLDENARILINFCLQQAAQDADNRSADWVKEILSSNWSEYPDIQAIRIVLVGKGEAEDKSDSEKNIEKLEEQIEKLTTFASLANDVAQIFQGKIANLKPQD